MVREVAKVAVSAMDRAAHDHDAPEVPEGRGVFVDCGGDGGEGRDGDERDLTWIAADLIEDEVGGVGPVLRGSTFGVAALREVVGGFGGGAGSDGDARVSGVLKEALNEAGAKVGVAPGRGNA